MPVNGPHRHPSESWDLSENSPRDASLRWHDGRLRASAALSSLALLSACAATQGAGAIAPAAPGFWLGLWHGFIFPIAWLVSLFAEKVALYAVPNSGGWYDFGYFLGIVVIGVGARKTHIVHRDRFITVRDAKVQE